MGKKSRQKRERRANQKQEQPMVQQQSVSVDKLLAAASGPTKGIFRRYIDANIDAAQADVRRTQLIREIEAQSQRRLMVYATDASKGWIPAVPVMMVQDDITSLIDILESIPAGSDVDMVVESVGGYAQVAELIDRLLRQRFKSVRFIVPHQAMSAATILVMSGDEILMDHRSSLGPIDPQVPRQGALSYPAQSYLDWLEKAADEEQKTGKLSLVTLAILQKVTPADIQMAEDATEEARKLVTEWLTTQMWAGLKDASGSHMPEPQRRVKARAVADRLASHKEWLSHGKMLSREMLLKIDPDLRIVDYSQLPYAAQVWELWVNLHFTFSRSPAFKMFESAENRIVKNVNIAPTQPTVALPPAGGVPESVQMQVTCTNCGAPQRIQGNFQKSAKLAPGYRPWPSNNKIQCSSCRSEIDLTAAREEIRRQAGGQDFVF
jgi:ClpP class serine protease